MSSENIDKLKQKMMECHISDTVDQAIEIADNTHSVCYVGWTSSSEFYSGTVVGFFFGSEGGGYWYKVCSSDKEQWNDMKEFYYKLKLAKDL